MAPPHKRRRLSGSNADASGDALNTHEPMATFSHGLEHLSQAPSPTATTAYAHTIPHVVEEVHIQIHQHVIDDANHAKLHRRQDGVAASTDYTPVVSVVASVDIDGSTTALTTDTPSSTVGSISVDSTTTVIASPSSSSVESSSDASTSSTSDMTSSNDAATTISSDTASPSSSSSSTESLSSSGTAPIASSTSSTSSESASSTDVSTSSGLESGFIGANPTTVASTTSSSSTNSTQSALTDSAIAAITGAASQQNLTTSALIIENNSTTFTSKTTYDLAISTSRSDTASSHSTPSLGAFVYLATLGNGDVETISRHSSAYVTTFPGGLVSTISPISSVSGSAVTTVLPDGSTSIFYSTTSLSPAATGGSQSTVTSVATVGPGGVAAGAGQSGTATSSSSTTSTAGMAGNGNNSGSNTPPAGTIAGGVVGGAAGLAVILLIAMLFLRWYRRRTQLGHQALPPNSGMTPEPDQSAGTTRDMVSHHPGMAERAGMRPLIGAVPALFRHQNRSRDTADTATNAPSSERGFTRVSGRKLPSSFSPGMSGPPYPPPTMPLANPEHNMSNTSFYRDSAGFYGGEGSAVETPPSDLAGPSTAGGAASSIPRHEDVTLSPGPQRRPTVHAPGPYVMSPTNTASPTTPSNPFLEPQSPLRSPPGTAGTMATFERSDTPSSLDPSRSSRFTEEV